MPRINEENNYAGRVNYAATVIARRGTATRTFDGCFENQDGDEVAVALFRRAQANPGGPLARNIFTYLSEHTVSEAAERYADIPTRDLKHKAAESRAKARAEFEAFMASRAA